MEKLAVVSGGSRGIGKAIVRKLAENGFDVAVCGRIADSLSALKYEIYEDFGTEVFEFVADVSQKAEVKAFGDFVLNLKIPPTILVNNAGVFIPGKILEEPDENLENMLSTNLLSAYYLSKAIVPVMIDLPLAHIFNISSIAGIEAYASSGSYSISKFAMMGLGKSLREELKTSNVRVTSILPGATLTDSWAGVELPDSRFMKGSDIAEVLWSAFSLSASATVEEIILRPQPGDI
ncbi:MAG: SDR family oxidoreductase [Cytophagaceae bacterium]|nr:SDR family oxidoreductase [Cytophagaceae bacterium]MBK9508622.1 SDR family oxidoreductase [Cytophagaceae bacterium]MBL0301797.1 SDR family oxidoreductase [Cytophagaceae bacterium]MBL0324623.1 SDR family oxidoreductase [Cytophagaceae bacterium]